MARDPARFLAIKTIRAAVGAAGAVCFWHCASVSAQNPASARSPAPFSIRKSLDRPLGDPKAEAARKAVAAYRAAFLTMQKSRGWAKAAVYFLTPDFKAITRSGDVQTRDEYIHQRERGMKNALASYIDGGSKTEALLDAGTRENYTVHNDTIIVTIVNSSLFILAPTATPDGKLNSGHQRRDVQVTRDIYRRTPQGLRLLEMAEFSKTSYLDGKPSARQINPRKGK